MKFVIVKSCIIHDILPFQGTGLTNAPFVIKPSIKREPCRFTCWVNIQTKSLTNVIFAGLVSHNGEMFGLTFRYEIHNLTQKTYLTPFHRTAELLYDGKG